MHGSCLERQLSAGCSEMAKKTENEPSLPQPKGLIHFLYYTYKDGMYLLFIDI